MQENEIDVLFVDDDSSFLKQAKIFLEKKKDGRLNVDTFTSAANALDEVRKNDYFAIVSDYQMPEMDGLEFLKTLREELNDEVFFIVLTGKGWEEVAMESLNLGADRYLLKSGDPSAQYDKLADMIFYEVERRRSEEIIERYRQDLEAVFDALREIAFVEDEDHNILMANEATSDFLGRPKEELEGQKCYELFHSMNEPIEGCPVEEILGAGELCESEFYDEDRDKYFLARAYPFTESEGKKRFILLSREDTFQTRVWGVMNRRLVSPTPPD